MSKMPFDYDFKPGEIAWAWYTNLSTEKGVELYFFEIEKFHGDYVSGWLLMSYDKPGRRICHVTDVCLMDLMKCTQEELGEVTP